MTNIAFREDAKKALLDGMRLLTETVQTTYSPAGRNVIINREGIAPHITKDGVTVAKYVTVDDSLKNTGIKILKDVAVKTADTVGDGTTSSIILANQIFNESFKYTINHSVYEIKKAINVALKEALALIQNYTSEIEESDIYNIAMVASNYDTEISNLLTGIYKQSGKYTIINVETASTEKTTYERIEGMSFDRGYLSSYFSNNAKKECILENCYVLVYDDKIRLTDQILPFLEYCKRNQRGAVIMAKEIDDMVLSNLITNTVNGVLPICALQMPSFGDNRKELLEDLQLLIGAEVQTGQISPSKLGVCSKFISTSKKTTFIRNGTSSEAIQSRIEEIKGLLQDETISMHRKDFLKGRLAALSNGVILLKVGGFTELEVNEKKDRIDDTIKSISSSFEEGVVMSTMSLYHHIGTELCKNNNFGFQILGTSLKKPLQVCCLNGDMDYNKISAELEKGHTNVFDFFSGIQTEDESLVRDPAKTARVVLETAVSISSLLATADVIIDINHAQ